MATKKKPARKVAGKVAKAKRAPASKPKAKAAKKPARPAKKLLAKKPKKLLKKPAAKKAVAKKPAAKKPSAPKAAAKKSAVKAPAKKVTARHATGKMVRPAPAAKPAPAPRRPAPAPARAAGRGRRAPDERRALPHKNVPKPAFSFNDYFDGNASPYPTIPPSRREVLPVAVEWKEKMRPGELYQAFKRFFEANEIGNRLIGPLREGAAAIIEFEGDTAIYKVVKVRGRAAFEIGRPASAEIYVRFSRHSVEAILAPNATKPIEYVERFCTLVVEPDPAKRIDVKLLCTHGEAIRKGYLGVAAAGGRRLAETLISLGYSLPQEFVRQLK